MTDDEGMEILKFKNRVNGLYSTIQAFNGTVKFSLLTLFATLAKAFDAMGASGATVVRKITYYLE